MPFVRQTTGTCAGTCRIAAATSCVLTASNRTSSEAHLTRCGSSTTATDATNAPCGVSTHSPRERIAARHVSTVYGACVVVAGTHLEPGVVQAWSTPVLGRIDIGGYPEGAGQAEPIVLALHAAGFASSTRADIMRWKRGKLLWNLGNAIEALSGRAEDSSQIEKLVRAEGIACFAAAGLSRTTDDEDAFLGRALTMGTIRGAEHSGGSTWQSLARAASAVETDYLNGEIVLLGRLHGVPTPKSGIQRANVFCGDGRAGIAARHLHKPGVEQFAGASA